MRSKYSGRCADRKKKCVRLCGLQGGREGRNSECLSKRKMRKLLVCRGRDKVLRSGLFEKTSISEISRNPMDYANFEDTSRPLMTSLRLLFAGQIC